MNLQRTVFSRLGRMSPRGREWVAFFLDWLLVVTLIFGPLCIVATAVTFVVMPSSIRFWASALVAFGGNLFAAWWQFVSNRTKPPSLGRRLVGADRPLSLWGNLRR